MAELAREKGVRTLAGMQRRCSPLYLRVQELVEEGYIGDVVSCHLTVMGTGGTSRTSDRAWMGDAANGANTMSISFGHAIDALTMCVGDFTEVSGVVSTQIDRWQITDTDGHMDVTSPDNILVSGRLASGGVVSAHVASQPCLEAGSGWRYTDARARLWWTAAKDGCWERVQPSPPWMRLPIPDRLAWVPAERA